MTMTDTDKEKDLSEESKQILQEAEERNNGLRRHAAKSGESDEYNRWRGDVVVGKAGVDVDALRDKLYQRDVYRKRADEAITKAEEEGQISQFNAETARINLRRRMSRGKTNLSLEGQGMGMQRIQDDVIEPWEDFIRSLGALDSHEHEDSEEHEEETDETEEEDRDGRF